MSNFEILKRAAAERAEELRGEASSYDMQRQHLPAAESQKLGNAAKFLLMAAQELAGLAVLP
jgi:hypothetical protein